MNSELWAGLWDLHFPQYHKGTFRATLSFLKENKVSGFIFGGDQNSYDEISHHTKGKPLFRERAAYKKNQDRFIDEILNPLDSVLGNAQRIWIWGNHERFQSDLVEEHPEFEGVFDHVANLDLKKRGWKIIELGSSFKHGRLSFCHGEWLTGTGNQASIYPAKKLVETVAGNAVAGHTHAAQSFTRVSPVDQKNKWMGYIMPTAGETNPAYLRNRPTAWVNGLGIFEFHGNGCFNCYPVIVSKNQFAWGGRVYKG